MLSRIAFGSCVALRKCFNLRPEAPSTRLGLLIRHLISASLSKSRAENHKKHHHRILSYPHQSTTLRIEYDTSGTNICSQTSAREDSHMRRSPRQSGPRTKKSGAVIFPCTMRVWGITNNLVMENDEAVARTELALCDIGSFSIRFRVPRTDPCLINSKHEGVSERIVGWMKPTSYECRFRKGFASRIGGLKVGILLVESFGVWGVCMRRPESCVGRV